MSSQWLENVFHTICDEWGYDYVKIDFIYAGAVDGMRARPERDAGAGLPPRDRDVRTWRASGSSWVAGSRLARASESWTGRGSGRTWRRSGIRRCGRMGETTERRIDAERIRNMITRCWMHGSLWLSDPDCLLVRESETDLTPDEVRALATVIALSGGMVLDSDNLPRLSAERRELISMLLPVYGKSAVPLDLFEATDMPQILRTGLRVAPDAGCVQLG